MCTISCNPWHRGRVAEYRAFDKNGGIIGVQDLSDTDSAIAWGVKIGMNGAALIERKIGEDWVCFQEFREKRTSSETQPER
jgi:hypothetical protein